MLIRRLLLLAAALAVSSATRGETAPPVEATETGLIEAVAVKASPARKRSKAKAKPKVVAEAEVDEDESKWDF